ncbi:MAG: 6-phosphogluconate dehydrogenase NAD-binding [Chthoniobacteraceae bacterium]|nr:6-phosphogluconate dehydrogenase NAD-binding [Chthoniobacteraceae bacterium]
MARKNRNVGLIGLGIIGSRAAAGLRAAGFPVFVWNRTPQPTPNFLGSPAAVAELCEIIQIFVSDAEAVFGVIEAMGDRLTANHIIICSATIGHEATLEAARFVEHKGARFLDAPFTGSKGAAEQRQLTYYVGGDEATLQRARPVLEATSKTILPMGKIGDAATVKVVTNMIAAVSVQAMSEALALTEKAGIAPELFAAALAQNACRSGTMDLKLPKMMTGDYSTHFSLKHMFKDVQFGIQMARSLGIDLPAATVTGGVMYGAINHGWGDLDFASLFKLYEQALENPRTLESPPDEPPAREEALEETPLEVVTSVPPDAKPATENGSEKSDTPFAPPS